jgi:hypothetical protein
MGLVIGNWQYEINPGLEGKWYLVQLLHALGEYYGVPRSAPRRRLYARANVPVAARMPRDLFWTPARTAILAFVAMLGETYKFEVQNVLPIAPTILPDRFSDLVAEGVLRARVFKGAKLHSLDPAYVAAPELAGLLRRIGRERTDLRTAVRSAYFRRAHIVRTGSLKQEAIIASIQGSRWRIDGVRIPTGRWVPGLKRLR